MTTILDTRSVYMMNGGSNDHIKVILGVAQFIIAIIILLISIVGTAAAGSAKGGLERHRINISTDTYENTKNKLESILGAQIAAVMISTAFLLVSIYFVLSDHGTPKIIMFIILLVFSLVMIILNIVSVAKGKKIQSDTDDKVKAHVKMGGANNAGIANIVTVTIVILIVCSDFIFEIITSKSSK